MRRCTASSRETAVAVAPRRTQTFVRPAAPSRTQYANYRRTPSSNGASIRTRCASATGSGKISVRCRRRDRLPLRAGRCVKLRMARQCWRGPMAPGALRAETRCRSRENQVYFSMGQPSDGRHQHRSNFNAIGAKAPAGRNVRFGTKRTCASAQRMNVSLMTQSGHWIRV